MTSLTRTDEDGVTMLILTRPPINALDREALDELAAAVTDLEADQRIRAIVLASGIDDIFCAGGDLKFWRQFPREMARVVSRAGRDVFERIARLRQPTIAALDGQVIGDGLALALAADLRIGSERVTFRVPEADYGFIPGWGVPGWLERQAGIGVAIEMVLTGNVLRADRAERVGLVNTIVPAGQALPAAVKLARSLARKSPLALAGLKQVLRAAPNGVDRGAWEEECFARVWGSEDWQEGIDALLAKRAPVFRP